MPFKKLWLALISLALYWPLTCIHAADVFDPGTGQVRLDSVLVGATRYQSVVVIPGRLVSVGSGAAKAPETYFDLATGQLTIRQLTAGESTYPDVVITVASVLAVGSNAPVNTGNTAPANTLVGLGGQNYPLRVSISFNASNNPHQPSAITYDFHKTDGSMTPCTYSASNEATCHGASNTITNLTVIGGPTDNSPPNNATLNAGPDSYGFSFEGKITGSTWTGTWTAVRGTATGGITTESGPFSVDVVMGTGNSTGTTTPNGAAPTIQSINFTPGAAAKLEVAFDIDMRPGYGTTGNYSPAKSYWATPRLFVIEFHSYSSGGSITLTGKDFASTGGVVLAQDRVFVFP
jgi:hypothetical protein